VAINSTAGELLKSAVEAIPLFTRKAFSFTLRVLNRVDDALGVQISRANFGLVLSGLVVGDPLRVFRADVQRSLLLSEAYFVL
jgi:hypothetical protein